MGKNQSASGLTNIVQYDTAGNISLVSGSTTLLYISSSGAIITTGVISGSNALSASYSISASNALAAQTASYVQNAQSASYVLTAQTASFELNAQSASYVLNAQSSSYVLTAQTASYVLTAQTASFVANAQSASNAVAAQTASYANNLTVAGTLTAQTLVVQTITSSVSTITGSTQFGSTGSNTHVFTGSVNVTGSLTVTTTGTELQVNASGVNLGNALTDSHVISGSLRVNPNGLFVSGSGLVGIGTTTFTATNGANLEVANSSVARLLVTQTGTRSFSLSAESNSFLLYDQTANVTRLTISSSGAATFSNTITATKGYFSSNGASDSTTGLLANASTNDSTTFAAVFGSLNAGYRMVVRADGSVGIGTTSPKSYSSLTTNGQIISLNNIGIDTNQSFRLNNYYNSDTVTDRTISTGFASSIGLDQTSGGLTFNISSVTASADNNITVSERMRITSGGNVGIGNWSTNVPQDRLHVNGALQVGFVDALNQALRIFWNGASSYGAIQTSSSSTLVLNPSGNNVGIGLTNPSNTLHINGSLRTGGSTTYWYSGNDSGGMYLETVGTSTATRALRIQGVNDAGNRYSAIKIQGGAEVISFETGDVERMRITAAGRVGIGLTNPTKTFYVVGKMSTTSIVSGQLIAGQITSNLNAVNSPNFILLFDMTNNQAGWSLAGTVNAAAWDCWNISTIWIRKLNSSFTVNAGVTGLYKSGCDFAICDITYGGARYIALRFTSNPEINVMWTGYGLDSMFNSDGSIQIVFSGVTVNTIYASY